jgi:hypothetical protein
MKILGVEIDFSFTNGDDMKKFEDNYEGVLEKVNSFTGNENLSEVLYGICEAIDTFFDKLAGEGTAKKLFSKPELKDRVQAFKEMKLARDAQMQSIDDIMKEFTAQTELADSKYSKDRAKR